MYWSKEKIKEITDEVLELAKTNITKRELSEKISGKVSRQQIDAILRENNIWVQYEVIKDLEGEIWKPLLGFEDTHQISNLGRIKSFCGHRIKLIKPYVRKQTGDLLITICGTYKKSKNLVYRKVIANNFIPNPNNYYYVHCIDGNIYNNSLDNLEWSNNIYNQRFNQTKEERKLYLQELNKKNRYKINEQSKERQRKITKYGLSAYQVSNLKHKYNINPEEFLDLIEKQDNKCAICGEKESTICNGKLRSLCVDHCHDTEKVRELLCSNCNRALGGFKDNVEIMEKAINYLKKHKNILPD